MIIYNFILIASLHSKINHEKNRVKIIFNYIEIFEVKLNRNFLIKSDTAWVNIYVLNLNEICMIYLYIYIYLYTQKTQKYSQQILSNKLLQEVHF